MQPLHLSLFSLSLSFYLSMRLSFTVPFSPFYFFNIWPFLTLTVSLDFPFFLSLVTFLSFFLLFLPLSPLLSILTLALSLSFFRCFSLPQTFLLLLFFHFQSCWLFFLPRFISFPFLCISSFLSLSLSVLISLVAMVYFLLSFSYLCLYLSLLFSFSYSTQKTFETVWWKVFFKGHSSFPISKERIAASFELCIRTSAAFQRFM